MSRRELLKRIYAHPLSDLRQGGLESLTASSLGELPDTLGTGQPQMLGDEPPELTDEDEEMLDQIWYEIEREQKKI